MSRAIQAFLPSALVVVGGLVLGANACSDSSGSGIGDPSSALDGSVDGAYRADGSVSADGAGQGDGSLIPVDGSVPVDAGRCGLLGAGPMTFRWSRRPGEDRVPSVTTTASGQVYALDIYNSSVVRVHKFEASGAPIWTRNLLGDNPTDGGPAGSVLPKAVATDSLGRVVVAGTFKRGVSLAGEARYAGAAMFVLRLDANGAVSYLKTFTGAPSVVEGVAIDGSDRVWVTGTFDGTFNLGGGALTSAGDDGFLLQLDANGDHLFSRRFGSQGNDDVDGMAIGPQGGPVVVGKVSSRSDLQLDDGYDRTGIYVASFDAGGTLKWSKLPQQNKLDGDSVFGVAATSSSVVVVGQYGSSAPMDFGGGALPSSKPGPPAAFVVRLGAAGEQVKLRTFGIQPALTGTTDANLGLFAPAIDSMGNVVVAGMLYRTVDFGLGPIPKTLMTSVIRWPLVLGFDPDLNIVYSHAVGGCTSFQGGSLSAVAFDGARRPVVGGSMGGSADVTADLGGAGTIKSVLFALEAIP
jgi:hypothetical protein